MAGKKFTTDISNLDVDMENLPAVVVEVKRRGRPNTQGDCKLRHAIENYVLSKGPDYTIATPGSVQNHVRFMFDGRGFAAMEYNKRGVNLWLKSEAIENVKLTSIANVKELKHVYNLRIKFYDTEDEKATSVENMSCIFKLIDASIAYQKMRLDKSKNYRITKERKKRKKQTALKKIQQAKETIEKWEKHLPEDI